MSFLQRRKGSTKEHFVVSHFDAYQDGTLAKTETADYEQHLRSCDDCREWVQRQDNLVAQLEMEMEPAAVLAPASAARIQQNLYSSMRRAIIMNNVRASVAAVGALAVLALVVGVVAWWQSSTFGAGVQSPAIGEGPALTLSSLDALDEQVIKAIGQGDAVMLAAALDEGADPNTQSSPGRPALYLAARRGNPTAVRLLIDAGADIHADTVNGPVLITAAYEGQREIVEMLLDAGAEINGTGSLWSEDDTALMAAADRGYLDIVELLIERGATINQLNSHGETALHSATGQGRPQLVRLLLENGADVDRQLTLPYEIWAAGSTPLHLAAHMGYGPREGSLEVARILIEHGAALDLEDEEGRTPLDIAGLNTEMGALLRAAGTQGSAEQGLSAFQGPAFVVPGGGRLVRVAGNGSKGSSGDGGPAIEASLNIPFGLAWDSEGNMYIGQDYRISKVDAITGVITTIAGTGSPGSNGDGGPATDAQVGRVQELAFDAEGNLYFPEYQSNSIRRIDTDGVITTVAGAGAEGFSPDGTPATEASLSDPVGIAFDSKGTLHFSDRRNHRVRIIDDDGTLKTVAGTGELEESGDGGPATVAKVMFPSGLTFDVQDNLYIGTQNGRAIRKVDSNGIISSVPGADPGFLVYPDAEGGLIVADWPMRIYRWTPDGTSIVFLEGGDFVQEGADPDGEQSIERIETTAVALDGAGNIFVIDDRGSHSVYRFEP